MENPRVLIDTSVVIDFLRKKNKQKAVLWAIKENCSCFMSSITYFELMAGATSESKQEDVKKVCKWVPVLNLDENIAGLAANIFRKLKKDNNLIEFRDIFIAATAIWHEFSLATFNDNHFERVNNINLYHF
jgi:tRNA(fMet)-specific endonuclease VapC